jgi:hypothetical protein
MKTIGRVATRGAGTDGEGTVDLIIGAGFKDGTLKPNHIYEIREFDGALTLVDMGRSAAITEEQPKNIWACGVETVLMYKDRWLMTLVEWRQYRAAMYAKQIKEQI